MKEQSGTKSEQLNRRSFFKRSWGWLGIIAGIEFSAVIFSFFKPSERKRADYNQNLVMTVGEVGNITPGSVTPYKSGKFYLVRMQDGGMMALSLTCTHLGCSVAYHNDRKEFICPCHASAFDINGDVMKPPAPRALDTYRLFVEHGLVKVDTGRVIRRNKFTAGDLVYA
jgi:cytochrome b6-f complex iron-sulfur subunit